MYENPSILWNHNSQVIPIFKREYVPVAFFFKRDFSVTSKSNIYDIGGNYDLHNIKVVFLFFIVIDCHIKLGYILYILSSQVKNHLLLSSPIVKARGVKMVIPFLSLFD